MTRKAPRTAKRRVRAPAERPSSSPLEESDASYEDDSVGEVGGFGGGYGSGDDAEEEREENGMIGQEFPAGGEVDEAEEEGAGEKDEGEIELESRGEEDEQGEDQALDFGETELVGQAVGHEGEKEEAEGAVRHLGVGERKGGED
jgi:hypothetical protein